MCSDGRILRGNVLTNREEKTMSKVKVEVTDQVGPERKAGTSTVRNQVVHIFQTGEKYPMRHELTLWNEDLPLKAGMYEFDASKALYIGGEYNRLQIRFSTQFLTPVAPRDAKAS